MNPMPASQLQNLESRYVDRIVEPTLDKWPSSIAQLADPQLQRLRIAARRRLIETSLRETSRLQLPGNGLDSTPAAQPLLTGDPDTTAIVMTGHQPVVFHSGLTFKYELTEHFAATNKWIGIAVVIDTDEGDAGEFLAPHFAITADGTSTLGSLRVQKGSLTTATGVYQTSRVKSRDDLNALEEQIANSLAGHPELSSRLHTTISRYSRYADQSGAEANTAIRREAGIGSRLLEIPLSVICRFPEVQSFWSDILEHPREFADCCNAELTAFRSDENIRNAANPFPNLKVAPDRCDLPFWILNEGTGAREILTSADVSRSQSLSDAVLIPRGPMISATLRLLFSDLFVHGTGGGQYDRFTDRLISVWWDIKSAPPFAVASASRFLFDSQRSGLLELLDLEAQFRTLQFNPQRAFGTPLGKRAFTPDRESRLNTLLASRESLLATMQARREQKLSARETAADLQVVNDTIKAEVAAAFDPLLESLSRIGPHTREALLTRKWPWFWF